MACGVLGISLKEGREGRIRDDARTGLVVYNHRGEESHGVAFANPQGKIESRREKGLVRDSDIFDDGIEARFLIGHTRYTTSSSNGIKDTQPIVVARKSDTPIAISHNGDITNIGELRELLRISKPMSDTRVVGRLIRQKLREGDGPLEAIRNAMVMCEGSYSVAMLVGGETPMIVALRDPRGYMPLCVGENEHGFYVGSESVAFGEKYFNARYEELQPGHMAVIRNGNVEFHTFSEAENTQHCWFQWIYMAKPSTIIQGRSVYQVRENVGVELAAHYRPDVDFVSPVPDSGRIFTYGYANATGIPIVEALMRDRYEAKRSFMQDGNASRISVARKKLDVMGSYLVGKRLLIIDDSLVRGNTTTEAIAQLRAAGVAEVHVAIASPPITHQCVYGLDFYNEELIARQIMNGGVDVASGYKKIAERIGADSVYYLSHESLVSAIGLNQESLCMACLNGSYAQKVELSTRDEKRR